MDFAACMDKFELLVNVYDRLFGKLLSSLNCSQYINNVKSCETLPELTDNATAVDSMEYLNYLADALM